MIDASTGFIPPVSPPGGDILLKRGMDANFEPNSGAGTQIDQVVAFKICVSQACDEADRLKSVETSPFFTHDNKTVSDSNSQLGKLSQDVLDMRGRYLEDQVNAYKELDQIILDQNKTNIGSQAQTDGLSETHVKYFNAMNKISEIGFKQNVGLFKAKEKLLRINRDMMFTSKITQTARDSIKTLER